METWWITEVWTEYIGGLLVQDGGLEDRSGGSTENGI